MSESLCSESEVRERLGGIGRSLYYELIDRGEFRTVKIGRRRLVVSSSVDEYIARLEQQELDPQEDAPAELELVEEAPPIPDLLTLPEAAAILRAPESTLRHWRSHELGPRSLKVGRRVMYRRDELEAWLNTRASVTETHPERNSA